MNMFTAEINGVCMKLATDPKLFSPDHPDRGTLAMLSAVELSYGQKLLDLGCGYGLVGIYAGAVCGSENIWMLDRDSKAIEMSRINTEANGCDRINLLQADGPEILIDTGHQRSFDWILSNPPYHEDFSVARRFIETSERLLINGGKLVLVVKRLEWYKNKMRSVFGGARVFSIDGYYVLISEKRSSKPDTIKAPKSTTRKHMKKLRQTKKAHRSNSLNGVPSEEI